MDIRKISSVLDENLENRMHELDDFFDIRNGHETPSENSSPAQLAHLLRVAVWHCRYQDVYELLSKGANPNQKSLKDNSAYDIADYRRDSLPGTHANFQDIIDLMENWSETTKRTNRPQAPTKTATKETFNDKVKKLKGKKPDRYKMRKPKR